MNDEEIAEYVKTNSRLVFLSMDWDDIFNGIELVKDKCGSYNSNAMGNLQTLDGTTGQWKSTSIIKTGEQWRLVFYVPQQSETKKPLEYNELLIAHELWEMGHLTEVGKKFQGQRNFLKFMFALQVMFLILNFSVYLFIKTISCGH